MAYLFAFGCFTLLGLAAMWLASLGYRDKICDVNPGQDIGERVRTDPELRAKANQLVAFWCTGTAVLSVPPLIPLYRLVQDGQDNVVSTVGLVTLGAYGFVLVCMGQYPFQKIKQYDQESRKRQP
jgi:hypothetical protein